QDEFEFYKSNVVSTYSFCAYLGAFPVTTKNSINYYFMFVSSAFPIGTFIEAKIYKITEVIIVINCDPQQILICSEKTTTFPENLRDIFEIGRLITNGRFYYAVDTSKNIFFDLSLPFDKTREFSTGRNFFQWNRGMIIPWRQLNNDYYKWICPIINGSIDIQSIDIPAKHVIDTQLPPDQIFSNLKMYHLQKSQSIHNLQLNSSVQLKIIVISRLSWVRAGARLLVRGLNDEGFVANFVETEQAIQCDHIISCFTQIRGSIPLFWSQNGLSVVSHKFEFDRSLPSTSKAFLKHFQRLTKDYGNIIICNLLGIKKDEGMLSKNFKVMRDKLLVGQNIKMHNYDFNAFFNINNLDSLWATLPGVKKFVLDNYFYVAVNTPNKQLIVSTQTGVVRTNCVDCLDRTNGFQSALTLMTLEFQMKAMGIFNISQMSLKRLHEIIKGMWVINGNNCSRNYAGTVALEKTKGNVTSMLRDTRTSIKRAFMNNFWDIKRNSSITRLCNINQPIYLFHSQYASIGLSSLPSILKTSSLCPNELILELIKNSHDFIDRKDFKIYIGTWNVAGGCERVPNLSLFFNKNIQDWLLDSPKLFPQYLNSNVDINIESFTSDIIVVGLQEMVDLTASNILLYNDQQIALWTRFLKNLISRDHEYVLISSTQLVGVSLFIFSLSIHVDHITEVSISSVKTGLGGTTGNKGGVAISMKLYASKLCFICSHFAAGNSLNNLNQRNQDYIDICDQLSFDRDATIFSHDIVFWLGDLNYRINLPYEETRYFSTKNTLRVLLDQDQLLFCQSKKKAFTDFKEGVIKFPPTYKYDYNSDRYDSSDKSRSPAYTDRILWWESSNCLFQFENPVTQLFYGRTEDSISDHRPVCSLFNVPIKTPNYKKLFHLYTDILDKATFGQLTILYIMKPDGEGSMRVEDILIELQNIISGFVFYRLDRNIIALTYPCVRDISGLPEQLRFPGVVLILKIIPSVYLKDLEKLVLENIKNLSKIQHKRKLYLYSLYFRESDLIKFDRIISDNIQELPVTSSLPNVYDFNPDVDVFDVFKDLNLGDKKIGDSIFYPSFETNTNTLSSLSENISTKAIHNQFNNETIFQKNLTSMLNVFDETHDDTFKFIHPPQIFKISSEQDLFNHDNEF
ncbi:hypothetical protein HZS_6715, partial [Henneguya salminicola]